MKKKKFIIAICVVILFLAFIHPGDDKSNNGSDITPATTSVQDSSQIQTPTYNLVSQSDYVRDGEKCQGYRVVANASITDDEIIAIYDEITQNSEYKYHTVWFYENEDDLTIPFATLDDEIESNGNPSIDR